MEKIENDDADEKTKSFSDKHYADFEPSAVPVAPDGGIAPGFGLESPRTISPLSTDNFICMRGPCRHYWHSVTGVDMENPDSNWGEGGLVDPLTGLNLTKPRQHSRGCLVNPGMETPLNGDEVYECSKWDPDSSGEIIQINTRRRTHGLPEIGRPAPPGRFRRAWIWFTNWLAAESAKPDTLEEEYDGNHPDDAA